MPAGEANSTGNCLKYWLKIQSKSQQKTGYGFKNVLKFSTQKVLNKEEVGLSNVVFMRPMVNVMISYRR